MKIEIASVNQCFLITGISLSGDLYTYQNPLNAESHQRWNWHGCPCCPPMFLKMVSSVPGFIYAGRNDEIYVNLFIESEAEIRLENNSNVILEQTTNYPWEGNIVVKVKSDSENKFSIKLRIPGWAFGVENPFDLYRSKSDSNVQISINGKPAKVEIFDGYVSIDRKWKNGDVVELILPMKPRFVFANDNINDLKGMVAIASGPLVYTLEGNFNEELNDFKIDTKESMVSEFVPELLNGVNIIKGKAEYNGKEIEFKAIPYYATGNIKPGDNYKVWIPDAKQR